jgi:hypothetical protein
MKPGHDIRQGWFRAALGMVKVRCYDIMKIYGTSFHAQKEIMEGGMENANGTFSSPRIECRSSNV